MLPICNGASKKRRFPLTKLTSPFLNISNLVLKEHLQKKRPKPADCDPQVFVFIPKEFGEKYSPNSLSVSYTHLDVYKRQVYGALWVRKKPDPTKTVQAEMDTVYHGAAKYGG